MTKIISYYECIECGFKSSKWLGKCPTCHQWNSFLDERTKKIDTEKSSERILIEKIGAVENESATRLSTGISEFDRVMGGGVTVGSITLIGGEPGIGKSTLLLEILSSLTSKINNEEILYVSGEESISQLSQRAERLKIKALSFFVLNETKWEIIKQVIASKKIKLFVLDSIQTTVSSELQSSAGALSQVREIVFELMNLAKSQSMTCFVIGHVTKDGMIAGPKMLEHMVDTVLYFEGEQYGQFRILRSIKNRFGGTNETGHFEMGCSGLKVITNPSIHFIDKKKQESSGISLSCVMEGNRIIMVEVQALVIENKFGNARRTTQGFDQNRLSMLVAIIEKYLKIPISYNDIYLNVAGGLKISSGECDLAVVASILSSYFMKTISMDTVIIGEVGLAGDVRGVGQMDIRIKCLEQLCFGKIIASKRIKMKNAISINYSQFETLNDFSNYLFNV